MSYSLAVLTKKAIDASLKQKWAEAISLNSDILKVYPDNIDAKIRLGRCYLQTKEFSKAKKIFKEVLEKDPINSIALRNYDLAKNQKTECNGNSAKLSTKALLKEPGTTCETTFQIISKNVKKGDITSGEELPIKIKKNKVEVYFNKKKKSILIGEITDECINQRLVRAQEKQANIKVTYIKWGEKGITVLIKTSIPIFKPDKVEIRPYLRKGTIEEPEMEIEMENEEEIE
jgi:tetratricopeptide (TPR) repeat protein